MCWKLRSTFIVLTMLIAAGISFGQFQESVERNARALQKIQGCLEGYAEAISGEVIDYPRIRDDRSEALITRATTGAMAIEWTSQRVPASSGGKEVCFVVSAGIMARPNTIFGFRLLVNNAAGCRFSTIDTLSWEAIDSSGIRLVFDGVMRDQNTDAFGYLRIYVPAELITPGQPVRFRAVGDSAGSRVWFMVFKDPDVHAYVSERVANEAFCDISLQASGAQYAATLDAPSSWIKNRLTYASGASQPRAIKLAAEPSGVHATFTFAGRPTDRFHLNVDSETVVDVRNLSGTVNDTRLFTKNLHSVKGRTTTNGGYLLEYRSLYAPRLGQSLVELSDDNKADSKLHLIVSTHQDIAWMDSPEQCVKDRDEKILTPTLEIMKTDPNYRFDLEDVLFLREYIERHPDRKEELRKYIAEGRLGIGASYNQPYEDLFSGEALVREFYAGRKWLRKNFPGCDARTYWNPDVPGRTMQMPQIMRKAGVDHLLISRFEKGLYTWLSPDGSGVLMFSPGHYGDFFERVGRKGFPEIADYVASFARTWSGSLKNGSANIPIVSMSDMSTPVRYDDMIETWNGIKSLNQLSGATRELLLPPIHYSNAEPFLNTVSAENLLLPVIKGERPNIWLYIHGPTHHWAVSAKREADFTLTAAETFSTVDALLTRSFAHYPQKELTSAWESLIYPDHGWGGKNGEITDSTFRAKYEYARDVAKNVLARSTGAIAARIRTSQSKGVPVVVFNSLSWKRTGVVRFTTTFPMGTQRKGVAVHDAGGRLLPSQFQSVSQHADGSIRSIELLFTATDVPPVGYATYYLRPSPRAAVPDTTSAPLAILQNRFYRVFLGEGGVRQIIDAESNKEILNTEKFLGGELFTMQSVGEDAGEWSEPQQPTMEGFEKVGSYKPVWRLAESGPVRQVVESKQEINHATILQQVILYSELKQIDFETSLLKWDGTKYREFRLAFPLKTQQGQVAYEVPFGVVEVGNDEMKGIAGERYTTEVSAVRPRSIQNWIGVSDNEIGVTISSSVAVWDYRDPTDQPMNSPLLQPVLLASRRSCHGAGPWYLQAGDHHFRFSLTTHRPGWRNGRRFGVSSNIPLAVVFNPGASAKPTLPEEKGFFSLSVDNIALGTIKKCDDDDNVIIRLYEDAGKDVSARLRFAVPLRGAEMTNIIEEEGKPGRFKLNEVTFGLTHYSIQTMKVFPIFR
jgi:alpha-mannosidase